MAYSRVKYAGNGSQTAFTVPFSYLNKSHVKVYVNGTLATVNWDGDSTIVFDSPPAEGAIIDIVRSSHPDGRLVDYTAGALLKEKDLDLDSDQLMYLTQENLDKLGISLQKDHLEVFDAEGSRIKNVGYPTETDDAATKGFVDDVIITAQEAQNYLNEAQAARDKAYLWAEEDVNVEVENGEYSAKHHAQKAEDQAGIASSHRTWARKWAEEDEDVEVTAGHYSSKHHALKAEDSAQSASTSASNAATSESNASGYASDALSYRDKAQEWAEQAEDVEVETGKYSAKHHAAKASTSASNAATSESNADAYASDALSYKNSAETYKNDALAYRDDAHLWAQEAEDVEVQPGEYSAYHWAKKAEAEANSISVTSVKDYGAIGNGTTDDTTAIQNALNNETGVEFEAGKTYLISSLLTVPSNRVLKMYGAVIKNTNTGNTGIFSLASGVTDVTLVGGSLRGPAYGGTPSPAPSYPDSNGAIRIGDNPAGSYAKNIRILNVEIAGWNDYGIFCEKVQNSIFAQNRIHTCGRDGMRFYGAQYVSVTGNHISNITPGYGGVSPNLNAYGVTFTRNPGDTSYPRSQYCEAIGNIVDGVPTWKGLDTHGGKSILFHSNTVINCHCGIGVDEGDTSGYTDAPPLRISIINNQLYRGTGNSGFAGINLVSSNSSAAGTHCVVQGNIIKDFGGIGNAAINVGYHYYTMIKDNFIIDPVVAGIKTLNNTTVDACTIAGNTISNLQGGTDIVAAIFVETDTANLFIDTNTYFHSGTTQAAIHVNSQSSGYEVLVAAAQYVSGDMTMWSGSSESYVTLVGGSGTSYTDSDAIDAINNDSDHGSTAQHNYFSGNPSDLNQETATPAEVLVWNGSYWEPQNVLFSRNPSDLNQEGASSGDMLVWNGSYWEPQNVDTGGNDEVVAECAIKLDGTIRSSNGVSSVTRTGTGSYEISLTNPLTDWSTGYAVGTVRGTDPLFVTAYPASSTVINVYVWNMSGNNQDYDFSLVVFGY